MDSFRFLKVVGATLAAICTLSTGTANAADSNGIPAVPAIEGGAGCGDAINGAILFNAADGIVDSVADPFLRHLLDEVLARNPELGRLAAEASAAEHRAPQVKALPDPTASLTWFLMPPQTRVGPQRATVNLAQRLPWFGTLKLDEQVAVLEVAAHRARLEAARLKLLTNVRADYLELLFLDAEYRLVSEDRRILEHYSELALARYASGVGIDQSVIKIQAEISRIEVRLLSIQARRAAVSARLNAMRDRSQATPLIVGEIATQNTSPLDLETLSCRAHFGRPEMAEANALIEAAATRVDRSRKEFSPEILVGLNYGYVGRREDVQGRLNPPEDNGQDIFGLSAGVSVPLWHSKLEAGVEEKVMTRLAVEERRRGIKASIDGDLGDLLHRIPLLQEQLQLYDGVLIVQARESLRSAESAYSVGTVAALDLLDAERVLLQVRIAAERIRIDLAVAIARLEGVVAAPLSAVEEEVES